MLRNKFLNFFRASPLVARLLALVVVGIVLIWLLSQHELITGLTRLMQSLPIILVLPSFAKRPVRKDQEAQAQNQKAETT